MFGVNSHHTSRNPRAARRFFLHDAGQLLLAYLLTARTSPIALFVFIVALFHSSGAGAQNAPKIHAPRPPAKGGIAELSSSGPQSRHGDVTSADGAVDLLYGNQRLRADH